MKGARQNSTDNSRCQLGSSLSNSSRFNSNSSSNSLLEASNLIKTPTSPFNKAVSTSMACRSNSLPLVT